MLVHMSFHHIGYAVLDLEATATFYEQGGYRRSATIFDPIQNVNICWLTKNGSPTVELLAPIDEKSPVTKTLEKVGVSPYHCCFIVDNMDNSITELRKQKYVLISKPSEAVAFCGSRVCFLYHKNVGLIELVESPANIIE